jgi:oligopeptide/dipeptide ABC transporter ATP-binding protein
MCQRVAIAMALVCGPKLLIADEPTTALDVTVQRRILDLLLELRSSMQIAVLFITHDLGVVAEICDEVAVMYAGEVVERGDIDVIFDWPRHPYTARLIGVLASGAKSGRVLASIRGQVPPANAMPPGCRFAPRCDYAVPERCGQGHPLLVRTEKRGWTRCIRSAELDLTRPS